MKAINVGRRNKINCYKLSHCNKHEPHMINVYAHKYKAGFYLMCVMLKFSVVIISSNRARNHDSNFTLYVCIYIYIILMIQTHQANAFTVGCRHAFIFQFPCLHDIWHTHFDELLYVKFSDFSILPKIDEKKNYIYIYSKNSFMCVWKVIFRKFKNHFTSTYQQIVVFT